MSNAHSDSQSPKAAFQNMVQQKTKVDHSEPENSLWQGGYSPKAMIGTWILTAIFSACVVVLCFILNQRSDLEIPAKTINLAGGGVVLFGWLVSIATYLFRRIGVHYELTTQRFIHKHGILTRTTDRIEVIDIDDVTYKQGIIERLLGVGKIRLTSSDRTHPELHLIGIDQVDKISELIDNTRRSERRRRSLHIEQG